MKYILLILWMSLSSLMAQESKQEPFLSKVYIKEGSIYVGQILQYSDSSLNILLREGILLSIPLSTIKKIIQLEDYPKIQQVAPYLFKEKGWYQINYLSAFGGSNEYNEVAVGAGFNTLFGYMYSRYFGIGIGLGMNHYAQDIPINFFPIYSEIRSYFYGKQTAYYGTMAAGYGFASTSNKNNLYDLNGGLMLHPALGIRFGGKKHFNVCLDVGLQMQKTNYKVTYPWSEIKDQYFYNYKRFIFRIGIQI